MSHTEHAPALPAAVLWDMDGTLVDTEPYWMDSEIELAESFGGQWDHELGKLLIGNPLIVSAQILREKGGIDLPDEEIVEALLDKVVHKVETLGAPWRPGARELLLALKEADVPNALVTMSYARFTAPILAELPEGTFDVVVTGDAVTNGKPHPEPYLTAAARLGVDIRDCVAIEDSIPGVTSAVAAGAHTLAVEAHQKLEEGPGRTVLDTLEGVVPTDLLRFASA